MATISKINVDGVEYEIADTLALQKINALESEIDTALTTIIAMQNELIGGDGV